MATYGNGIKYSAAATSGGVVPANSFAVVTYTLTTAPLAASNPGYGTTGVITRFYPAGATVAATFTVLVGASSAATYTATYTFANGVILANS